jgi:periplasmic copper chaperone A
MAAAPPAIGATAARTLTLSSSHAPLQAVRRALLSLASSALEPPMNTLALALALRARPCTPFRPAAPCALVTASAMLALLALQLLPASTAVAANSPSDASAPGQSVPGLTVKDAWIRWLPAGLPAGGYLTLANSSDRPLVLVSASSTAYGEVGLHRTMHHGGMSKMTPVASVTIPAHGSLDFAASGYHLMLMQPTRAISPGEHLPITLHFQSGETQTVEFQVRKPSSTEGSGQHGMPGMSGMPGMPH